MLSRRSVRVKVMQQLYSMSLDKELSFEDAIKAYYRSVENSFNLYLLNLYCIIEICSHATEDAKLRQSKHIKSEVDKVFTDRIYSNPLISSLEKNKFVQNKFKAAGFSEVIDGDIFKKIYKEFTKEPSYHAYLLKDATNDDHIEILLELYRFCRRNDLFNEVMDDRFAGWCDDKSLVIGALKKTLKRLPSDEPVYEEHYPDKDTVDNFGLFLLKTCIAEEAYLAELIKPVLDNWDSDRVALVDMILIKMGIIEMLYFKTIPPKVTLNEYVELSKLYSTDKSKDFVNGILDKILKELQKQDKIVKEGRGLLE